MAGKPGLRWERYTISANIERGQERAFPYLARTTQYYSLRAETYAKTKAPWRDRSGDARGGLTGSHTAEMVNDTLARFTIEIAHSMPYGLWLEVRYGKKYAIINKTVFEEGEKFYAAANQLMAKMFGGQ